MQYAALEAATRPYFHRLADLAADPTFAVDSAESVKNDDRELIRVTFHLAPPEDKAFGMRTVGGNLLLDPAANWCLQSYEFLLQFGESRGSTMRGTLAFAGQLDGVPLLKLHTSQFRSKFGNTTDWTRACSEVRLTPATVESFRLPAFGLPDIDATAGPADSQNDDAPLMATSELRSCEEKDRGYVLNFVVHIKNGGMQPATIVGAFDSCRSDGCYKTEALPKIVPAGGTCDILVSVGVGEIPLVPLVHRFYTDAAGQGVLRCPLRAKAAAILPGALRAFPPTASTAAP